MSGNDWKIVREVKAIAGAAKVVGGVASKAIEVGGKVGGAIAHNAIDIVVTALDEKDGEPVEPSTLGGKLYAESKPIRDKVKRFTK